ncbi:cyclic nucleotide-binding domain-containing protein [uncultured Rhodoblastus sp.]|uniref:cyclic nucleotide-binding domain-containing protein n=1 Tax=uncultured Rhodoblastus sp. TaxID=543037 RepID=UPI0025F8B61A|nr:cyclic nucleotide-binding domain-containing protein [uncultured Rhodoblastus sp.]
MSLESDIKILIGQPIFAELAPEALRLIAFASEPLRLGPGDVVFRQGEPSEGGYVVISGALSLDSTESPAIAGKVVGPGVLLGELALIVPTQHSTTAIARQNSNLLKIPRALFIRALEASPASARRLKSAFARQLQQFVAELNKARKAFLD